MPELNIDMSKSQNDISITGHILEEDPMYENRWSFIEMSKRIEREDLISLIITDPLTNKKIFAR